MRKKWLLTMAVLTTLGMGMLTSVPVQGATVDTASTQDTTETANEDDATVIQLNTDKVQLAIGKIDQLELKNATSTVQWWSSNTDVVKVYKGKILGVGTGKAKIIAVSDKKQYVCDVVVADFDNMSEEQAEVVAYAMQFIGNPYRYGGVSLTNGADCSGFTMAVYQNFGYSLPHSSYGQIAAVEYVSPSDLMPGDLIFYGSSRSNCTHVGMYIGDNKIVHASTEQTGIKISQYNYRNIVGYGRVLKLATFSSDVTVRSSMSVEISNVTAGINKWVLSIKARLAK